MKCLYNVLLLIAGLIFFYSCSENPEENPEIRLFSPVLKHDLSAQNNTITVDIAKMLNAVSYKIEISRDNFKTVIKTLESTTSKFVITDLLWNTNYQVRATAIAATVQLNSMVSDLGSITTERFPSIMKIPAASDVIDNAARVHWLTGAASGAAVTQVKVFAAADEVLAVPLADYSVTSAEQLSGEKIIYGLNPGTEYQLAIYSDNLLRGWEKYTTKDALPTGSNVVDLRGITPTATTLIDALANAPAGATVILDGDQNYKINSAYIFDKAITVKSGYSITNTTGAVIDASAGGEFGLPASGFIDLIAFDGVSIIGTVSRYVFNPNTIPVSTIVGEIKFINCKITSFRDLIRTRSQWATGGINLFTVDNCIITDISSSGLILVDASANNTIPNIVLKNSTFFKVQRLINHKSTKDSNSLIISDCTFSESPKAASFLDYTDTTNILQGITITNTIFGRGGENAGSFSNSFIKSGNLPATGIFSSNVYKTNDFVFTSAVLPATTAVPVFSVYPGSVNALWVDPLNGNFNFNDSAFAGKSTCGDPRWRK